MLEEKKNTFLTFKCVQHKYIYFLNENLVSVKQFNIEPLSEVEMKWEETCGIRKQFLNSPNITINYILEHWPTFIWIYYGMLV